MFPAPRSAPPTSPRSPQDRARSDGALPERFAGVSLGELAPQDLLQLLERSRRTGRLLITRGYTVVTIDWIDGGIVGARTTSGRQCSDEILMTIVGWDDGSFELVATTPTTPTPSGIAPSVAHLLLEHARLHDKEARACSPAAGGRCEAGAGNRE